ncbi:MAG: hypothetical protein AAFY11_01140, partial [Cyanobacteria bacterium J06641_5]
SHLAVKRAKDPFVHQNGSAFGVTESEDCIRIVTEERPANAREFSPTVRLRLCALMCAYASYAGRDR